MSATYYKKPGKTVAASVKYILRIKGSTKKPAGIWATSFALGDVVSGSHGTYKVQEVFWTGDNKRGWKAEVLLKKIDSQSRKPEQKPRKKFRKKR